MAIFNKSLYFDTGDRNYEAETCYYIGFQIKSIKLCLSKLREKSDEIDISVWEDVCQYYHFYCDHLLFSLGQISNRLVITKRTKEKYKNRIDANRLNFGFDDNLFPIIANKKTRNTIEHLDEYNVDVIIDNGAVGGFNVIFAEMDNEIKDRILKSRELHPYYYDSVSQEIVVFRKREKLVINLEQLCYEVSRLEEAVLSLKSFLD